MFSLVLLAALTLAQTREGFLGVPGGPVYYRVEGAGRATPVLMVHGGPGGNSCAFLNYAPLTSDRRIAMFDQLGSGRSARPRDPSLWRMERYVEELHTVRRKLGLKRVHLLGHSWGGSIVAQYVLIKGTKGIASLVLSSALLSTPDWIRDADELRRQLPDETQAILRKHEQAGTTDSDEYKAAENEYNRRFVRRNLAVPFPADCNGAPANSQIYESMWGPSEFHATGTLKTFDVTPRLGELKLPVLLIVGEFDEARPETARRYQGQIPGAQLKVVPDAAHGH
jgi:proline iminopeptidase